MNNKIPESPNPVNRIFEPILSDEKLLEVLSTYHKNSKLKNLDNVNLSGLPFSFGILSDLSDLSQNWVSKRYHLLVQEGFFLPKYIINPFFFNFKLFVICYDRKNSEYIDSLRDFTIFDTKLDYTNRIRIVIHSEHIQKMVSATLFNNIFDISKIEFFNNVSGISSNFSNIPNFNFNLEKNKKNTAIFGNNNKKMAD